MTSIHITDNTHRQSHLLKECGSKNSKIQNKVNERDGKESKLYHLAKSLLYSKDTENVK
jgi:hypothetical protein